MTFDQSEFNMRVTQILEQLTHEVRRIRDGKSLSNLRGVEQDVKLLGDYIQSAEKPRVRKMDIPL